MQLKPLYGLVVCGGESLRMGQDKSLLEYYNLPQRYYMYQLLEKLCQRVFISCNKNQVAAIDDFYNFIVDKPTYSNIGPMASILSAYDVFKEASFLVIGCDYPFLTELDIKRLIENRSEENESVCFFDDENKIEQPLLAIYEQQSISKLVKNFESQKYSLKAFLNEINTEKIIPHNPNTTKSINTPEQYHWAIEILKNLNLPK